MMSRRFVSLTLCALPLFAQGAVEFNRDIRPILSDRCYTCHGPAVANRQSKLRLDNEQSAKAKLSEIARRITAGSQPVRMPPANAGAALSDREMTLIKTWIAQGAPWEKHWSFVMPKRPATGAGNPIDNFVRARLEREGLGPSPEAGKATLIRRVTFDLTGLPATLAEVDAFEGDSSPNAYEKVVDHLLASPRYGERMAIRWLDAARYADTNGYQTDGERYMWRWRDWVIDAFNRNMPYDEFAVKQIAGDMMPSATLDDRIASGFNRNHRANGEGGIVPEEYAVEYVVDRVDTTATVFLGLTAGCARCHDHKYDPITQKEFYQLYAYFDNIPERGNAQKYGNSPPMIKAPTADQQASMAQLDAAIGAAEKKFVLLNSDAMRGQRDWEKTVGIDTQWSSNRGLAASFPLDPDAGTFDGRRVVTEGDVANFGFYDKFTISAWIKPSAPDGAIVTRTRDEAEGPGYGMFLRGGRIQVNLVLRWLDDAGRVETRDPIELNQWHHVAFSYDGSRFTDGIKIYVDGVERALKVNLDQINQNFAVKEPLRIGGGAGPDIRFRGTIGEVRIYQTALDSRDMGVLAAQESVGQIAALDPSKRTAAQSDKLRLCWLDRYAPHPVRDAWQALLDAREKRDRYYDGLPTVMVMQEMPVPRDTFLLKRGAYDHPGEKVERGVPAVLPPLATGVENNRLGFARWLVDPANPLTARVAVNRFWQMYFGTGVVKTVEDFGSQGEPPSNPELLDWLATEFMRTGWNVKAMQKTIVMSATYRQSSKASPELLQRDPENRLLARGPRFRLPAEAVRDQALAISGLLVERIGGPSVKPYQPAGLWKELSGGEDYVQDKGEGLYRQSIYTFWKRASPPPMMVNFDAPGREACTVRETRTNTPLQALDLMNDVAFIEASRMLGQRMMKEGGNSAADRLAFAFRLATARAASDRERAILLNNFRYSLDRFQTDPAASLKLLGHGDTPWDRNLNANELAAYAVTASLILNLDEVVTRE
jgi:hypothetical protein